MDPVSVPGPREPRRLLASVYSATVGVAGLSLASLALAFGRPWVAGGVGALALASLALGGRVRRVLDPEGAADPDPETARALDDLRRLYARGEISDEEYERRYDAAVGAGGRTRNQGSAADGGGDPDDGGGDPDDGGDPDEERPTGNGADAGRGSGE